MTYDTRYREDIDAREGVEPQIPVDDQPPTGGEMAAETAPADGDVSAETAPVDGDVSAETAPAAGDMSTGTPPSGELSTRIWPQDQITSYQERWREVQLRFVDDPHAAAAEAETLAGEILDRFTASVTERKRELDAWHDTAEQADTEQMRTAVRNYRRLIDRLFEV